MTISPNRDQSKIRSIKIRPILLMADKKVSEVEYDMLSINMQKLMINT